MLMSPECDKIAVALVKFQGVVSNPNKARTASMGTYSYTYAALPDIVEELREVLAAYGLAVIQSVGSYEGNVTISTLVMHESGQWIESEPLSMPSGSKPQDIGSAITYARRYSYAATLGLVTDDDADGQQSAPAKKKAAPKKAAPKTDKPAHKVSAEPLTMPEMPKDRPDENSKGEAYIDPGQMTKMLEALRGKITDDALIDLADQYYEVPTLWHLTVDQARALALTIINGKEQS